MKRLLLIAVIALAAWNYHSKSLIDAQLAEMAASTSDRPRAATPSPDLYQAPEKQTPRFSCDGRQHCSQMNSRAEAVFFIQHCPDTKMDGDHDGVPCENDSRF